MTRRRELAQFVSAIALVVLFSGSLARAGIAGMSVYQRVVVATTSYLVGAPGPIFMTDQAENLVFPLIPQLEADTTGVPYGITGPSQPIGFARQVITSYVGPTGPAQDSAELLLQGTLSTQWGSSSRTTTTNAYTTLEYTFWLDEARPYQLTQAALHGPGGWVTSSMGVLQPGQYTFYTSAAYNQTVAFSLAITVPEPGLIGVLPFALLYRRRGRRTQVG